MMKKQIFVSVVLFISLVWNTYSFSQEQQTTDSTVRIVAEISQDETEQLSVKDIKKEVKRRKKLHKGLLNQYNHTFNPKYLYFIEQNALKILSLQSSL